MSAGRLLRGAGVVTSALTAWTLLFVFVFSGLQEGHSQAQLYAQFRARLVKETAPTGGAVQPGTPVALLSAARAGIHNQVVVEGTGPQSTTAGPALQRSSVLPGQAGWSVVLGRSLSFAAPFAQIGRLRPGDAITAVTQQGRFTYLVSGLRRAGDPLPAPPTSSQSRLVLVTAEGNGPLGRLVPDHVLYVDAALHGLAVPPSPGPQGQVPANERPMHGDSGTLPLVVLGLQLVLLATLLGLLLDARWGRPQALLIGGPAVFAALWFASQSAAALVPNIT